MPRFGRLSTCGHLFPELLSRDIANNLTFKEVATPDVAEHLRLWKLC
jgi:hypothetical protein